MKNTRTKRIEKKMKNPYEKKTKKKQEGKKRKLKRHVKIKGPPTSDNEKKSEK
jgi:hypothetical protein